MKPTTRSRRYLESVRAADIPVKTTFGVPYEAEDGVWAVRILCPDGRPRMFRTAAPRRKTARPFMSMQTRFDVLARDRFRCQYCGRSSEEVALHVDHYTPLIQGGTDDPDNLVTACRDCNLGKSTGVIEVVERLPE